MAVVAWQGEGLGERRGDVGLVDHGLVQLAPHDLVVGDLLIERRLQEPVLWGQGLS